MAFRYSYRNRILRCIATLIDALGYAVFSFRTRREIAKEKVRKIIVSRPDQIGDNFLMTSFVATLHSIFPNALIDVLVSSYVKEIWEGNPAVRRIIIFNNPRTQLRTEPWSIGKIRSIIRHIKSERYDLFVDARGEPLTALLGFFGRVPIRAGFAGNEFFGFLYTHSAEYIREKNEFEKYKDLLALFGWKGELSLPRLYVSGEVHERIEKFVQEIAGPSRIVALHLSSGGKYKVWPTERFAELAQKIHSRFGQFRFAVFGGPGEAKFFQKFIEAAPDIDAANLIGKLSLKEAYVFLSRCFLFVGNDSSLAHFAGSLNIPTVDIINVAVGGAERSRPPGSRVHILEGCNPRHNCKTGNCYPCPNMTAISVETVFRVCEKILTQRI